MTFREIVFICLIISISIIINKFFYIIFNKLINYFYYLKKYWRWLTYKPISICFIENIIKVSKLNNADPIIIKKLEDELHNIKSKSKYYNSEGYLTYEETASLMKIIGREDYF